VTWAFFLRLQSVTRQGGLTCCYAQGADLGPSNSHDQRRVYAWDLARAQAVGSQAVFGAPVSAIAASGSARRILAVATDEKGARGLLLQAPGL
jgi:hypothetical protein